MNQPILPQPSSLSIAIAAALATFIAVGLLTAVAFLFQRDGAPMEQLAAAERACAQHVYVSERDACMREWLARACTQRGKQIARELQKCGCAEMVCKCVGKLPARRLPTLVRAVPLPVETASVVSQESRRLS